MSDGKTKLIVIVFESVASRKKNKTKKKHAVCLVNILSPD